MRRTRQRHGFFAGNDRCGQARQPRRKAAQGAHSPLDADRSLDVAHISCRSRRKPLLRSGRHWKEMTYWRLTRRTEQRCRCVQKQDAKAKDQECGRVLRGLGRKNKPSSRAARLRAASRGDMPGGHDLKAPSIGGYFCLPANAGDNKLKIQIVRIGFGGSI